MGFGFGGASTELTLVIRGDGKVAVKELGKVDKAVGKVSKSTVNWTSVANKASLAMIGVGAAAVGAFVIAAKEAGKFESVMKDVEIQSGATKSEMEAIKKLALDREMVKLGKSGTQVAEVFKRLAGEGLGVAKMRALLKPLTQAAIVLGEDEAATTKLVLNVMEQFRIETENASSVTDDLANALANTSFQGDELSTVLSTVGSVAGAAGFSLSETIIITDQVQKSFGIASKTGRGFAALLASIQAPSDKTTKAFARTTVSIQDMQAAFGDSIEFTRLLTRAISEGLNPFEAFDRIAGRVATTIGRAVVPRMEETREAFKNVGFGAEFAEEKMDTWEGSLQMLSASLDNIKEGIGKDVIGALRKYVDWMVDATEDTEALTDSINTGLKIALGVGLVGAVGQAIIQIAKITAAFRTLGITAGTAWAVVSGPVGIGVGVAAAVGFGVSKIPTKPFEVTIPPAFRGLIPEKVGGPGLFLKGGEAQTRQQKIEEFEALRATQRPGLAGLLDFGFGERFGLQVADMSDEFEGLMESVKLAKAEIEFDKKGNILPKWQEFAVVIQMIEAQLSAAKREAEGFLGIEGGIETLAARGIVPGPTIDILLKGLLPFTRAEEEAAKEAAAARIAAEEEAADLIHSIRAELLEEHLALEEQAATLVNDIQVEQLGAWVAREDQKVAQAQETADLIHAIQAEQLAAFGANVEREVAEIQAALEGMSFEEAMQTFFGDPDDTGAARGFLGDLEEGVNRSLSRGISRALRQGEFDFKSFVDILESTLIEITIEQTLLQAGVGGIIGGLVGNVFSFVGGLFDNPVNDAMARFEGARFARFFGEGIEQERMRSSGGASVRGDGEQTINNNQVYNISTVPQDPRETRRELVRAGERDVW